MTGSCCFSRASTGNERHEAGACGRRHRCRHLWGARNGASRAMLRVHAYRVRVLLRMWSMPYNCYSRVVTRWPVWKEVGRVGRGWPRCKKCAFQWRIWWSRRCRWRRCWRGRKRLTRPRYRQGCICRRCCSRIVCRRASPTWRAFRRCGQQMRTTTSRQGFPSTCGRFEQPQPYSPWRITRRRRSRRIRATCSGLTAGASSRGSAATCRST